MAAQIQNSGLFKDTKKEEREEQREREKDRDRDRDRDRENRDKRDRDRGKDPDGRDRGADRSGDQQQRNQDYQVGQDRSNQPVRKSKFGDGAYELDTDKDNNQEMGIERENMRRRKHYSESRSPGNNSRERDRRQSAWSPSHPKGGRQGGEISSSDGLRANSRNKRSRSNQSRS